MNMGATLDTTGIVNWFMREINPPPARDRVEYHVDDIVSVLQASMARPDPGSIYNVCDDAPAASADVVAFAAALLGVDPPPLIAFDNAGLSAMARSFYADNRLVSNKRIKAELGVNLRYPDFRSGLRRVLEQESAG